MLERADHWTPPDSLGYSSLRPVRLTGQGKAVIAIAVALVIGAIVLGVLLGRLARRQEEEQRLLRDQGIASDATVTRAWIGDDKERQPWIAYRFDYAGSIYTRRIQTPRKIWQVLRAGSTIPVRFVPSQPSISHPIAWSTRAFPFWLAWLLAGTMAAVPLLVLTPLRRQIRLLTEGRPAPCRVTAIKNAGKVLVVQYEFRLLNGVVVQGRANANKAPDGDAVLCVLYDPENPRRNALYPMSLVRLENAPTPRR